MPAYEVHRSTVIQAAAHTVFNTVADFGTWTTWSPWLCVEPGAQVTVSETPNAVGSLYAWEGELVGKGELEHEVLEPPSLIDQEIRFIKPFRSRSRVTFEIEPLEGAAKVTWHMRGKLPWFLFWMRSQLETFVGMDYERGLSMLSEYIETGKVLSRTDVRGEETVGPLEVVGVRASCPLPDVGSSMTESFTKVQSLFATHALTATEPAVSIYHKFDFVTRQCEYTCGYAVPQSAEQPPAPLVKHIIPAVRALGVRHTGSYRHLGNAWSAGHQFARCRKLKLNKKVHPFEVYRSDPQVTLEADWVTDIYLPLR